MGSLSSATWIAIGGLLVLSITSAVAIWSGHGPALWKQAQAIWNGPQQVARYAVLVIAVLIVFLAIKSSTQQTAEQKASEWLTSYNGTATTDIVGPIKATVPGLLSSNESPTPLPSPSVSPSASPTPIPTPSATPQAGSAPLEKLSSSAATPNPTPTGAEQKRMDAQLRAIRDRTKHHGDVMAYFYVSYFVAIIMVMCAALVVAITLFFIAQGGWKGTHHSVRAIFIIASAIAAFYGLFPPVFQQQKNITDNKQLFLQYKSLESEVESYPVTRATLKTRQSYLANSLIISTRKWINLVTSHWASTSQKSTTKKQ